MNTKESGIDFLSWLQDTLILMPNWKWIGIALTFTTGFILIGVARHFFVSVGEKLIVQKNTPNFIRHFFAEKVHSSLGWVVAGLFWLFSFEALNLHEIFTKGIKVLVQVVMIFHLMRLAYSAVEAFGKVIGDFVAKSDSSLDDQLAPFATKTMKVLVVILGILLTLQSFGFNVVSLLAGLGIGGLALALAAQDTAANLFGSITIILDRPFQLGDWIKVGDTEGVVEEIGFRSTRIRTFYKSLVSIPNATMAKEKIDNMGVRPTRRIRHVLGVTYGTSPDQIQKFIDQIRYLLIQHPNTIKEEIAVNLTALGDFSLQIVVNCFIQIEDGKQELPIQQELLLDILEIAEGLKIEFAFPTQTLHIEKISSQTVQ